MIKKIVIILVLVLFVSGCSLKKENKKQIKNISNTKIDNKKENKSIMIKINDIEYSVVLEDNETVNEFIKKLPLNIVMTELNGNEKYANLEFSLPTNSSNPKKINKGDLMLYGDDCLVIFYKTFNTSYSYTKIGHIDNLPNLGEGSITVSISK